MEPDYPNGDSNSQATLHHRKALLVRSTHVCDISILLLVLKIYRVQHKTVFMPSSVCLTRDYRGDNFRPQIVFPDFTVEQHSRGSYEH